MNAQQLKNAILQEAIEGRLVPQDPNDEPASALLARIRKEKERLVKEGKLRKSALKEITFSEDEAPFEIPDSWEWCKLGWIGDWGAGATPAKGNSDFYNNGTIPWLRTGELNNGFVYDSEIKVTPKALEKCSLRMCEIGDVLIAMYGATIGKVAIAGIKLTTNQACCACTPYHVYNKYLLYYLMASKKTFIEMGEGGAQPNISREKIVAFPFALPPLNEQHRIVAKIEELLPKVEEYGKAQDALNKLNTELPERLKKSILQEAIEGRLVPQDPNDEPASVLLAKIRKEKEQLVKEGKLKKKDLNETHISEDEIPFEIPDSWKWVRLGDVTEIARGGSPRPIKEYLTDAPNGLNWIKIGDTDKGGKYINSCKEKIKPEGLKKTRMVHPGDFLLTNSMSFGRPYITNIEGCIHDGWLMISPYAGVFDQSFLFYVLSSAFAHKQFSDKVAGAVVQNLNSDKVADSYVPIPPLAEQHRIVEKLEQVLGEIDKLMK